MEVRHLKVLQDGPTAERLLMGDHDTRIDVVVVAHGPEPLLDDCLTAILSSTAVSPRILLVNNGCTNPVMRTAGTRPGVEVISTETNLGFAGGVMAASTGLEGEHLALINSDAIVEPDCLRLLAAALEDVYVGIVMPMILRRSDGRVNSAGNPLHVLGFSWAGQNGTLAGPTTSQGITVASERRSCCHDGRGDDSEGSHASSSSTTRTSTSVSRAIRPTCASSSNQQRPFTTTTAGAATR